MTRLLYLEQRIGRILRIQKSADNMMQVCILREDTRGTNKWLRVKEFLTMIATDLMEERNKILAQPKLIRIGSVIIEESVVSTEE